MSDDEEVASQPLHGTFVVVCGPPASGKTTLARALAPAVGLPLLAKDTIKKALMSVLPVPDIETSRIVGRASVAALLAVGAETNGAVPESVWRRSFAVAELRALPGIVVEVFAAAIRKSRRSGTHYAAGRGHQVTSTTIGRLQSWGIRK